MAIGPRISARWAEHAGRRRANRRAKQDERRAPRARDSGPPSRLDRVAWRVGDLSDAPWFRGSAVAAAFYVLLVGASSLDFFGYRGEPVETALVLSVELSDTVELACGYRAILPNTPAEVVTYQSLTTREGHPDRFRMFTCPGTEEQPGDRVPVIRTGVEDDYVFPDPIVTVTQLLTWPLPGVAGVGVLATMAFVVREEFLATSWSTKRRQAKAAAEAEELTVEAAIRRVEARRKGQRP
jgi:hypothetical protein